MIAHTSAAPPIQTRGLTKTYRIAGARDIRVAVSHLSLTVQPGEVFGFLGPNGAGKTSTIKMLLSFLQPTSGEAFLFGLPADLPEARQSIGYVPEHPYFPKFLTSRELVREQAILAGLGYGAAKRRADECLDTVGMLASSRTPLSKLSKGMTQRIGLACALVGDPKLLILDEPSSGLDPVGRKELREMLGRFRGEGKTVFVSSHLLTEMEPICDQVGVLAGGVLVACAPPREIVRMRDELAVEFDCPSHQEDSSLTRDPAPQTQTALVPTNQLYAFIDSLRSRHAVLRTVKPQRETLEDAFLRLVGEGASS